ncbi:hypothetical protein Y032_0345g3108 [Ancylostoma ceylanicum]|nr:hypothetical protein Y032_0345g3108 [Ancylostoma ceylanicum]
MSALFIGLRTALERNVFAVRGRDFRRELRVDRSERTQRPAEDHRPGAELRIDRPHALPPAGLAPDQHRSPLRSCVDGCRPGHFTCTHVPEAL